MSEKNIGILVVRDGFVPEETKESDGWSRLLSL